MIDLYKKYKALGGTLGELIGGIVGGILFFVWAGAMLLFLG